MTSNVTLRAEITSTDSPASVTTVCVIGIVELPNVNLCIPVS